MELHHSKRLPATLAEFMSLRKGKSPSLRDQVEALVKEMYNDPEFRDLLEATHNKDAKEKKVVCDRTLAALKLREHAKKLGRTEVIEADLSVIIQHIERVLGRHQSGMKARRLLNGGGADKSN